MKIKCKCGNEIEITPKVMGSLMGQWSQYKVRKRMGEKAYKDLRRAQGKKGGSSPTKPNK